MRYFLTITLLSFTQLSTLGLCSLDSIIERNTIQRDRLNEAALFFTHKNMLNLNETILTNSYDNFSYKKNQLKSLSFQFIKKHTHKNNSNSLNKRYKPKTPYKSYLEYEFELNAAIPDDNDGKNIKSFKFKYLTRENNKVRPLMIVLPPIMGSTYIDKSIAKMLVKSGSDVIIPEIPGLFIKGNTFESISNNIYQSIIFTKMLLDHMLNNSNFNINREHIGAFGLSQGAIIASTLVGAVSEISYAYILCGGGNLGDIVSSSTRKSIRTFRETEHKKNKLFKNIKKLGAKNELWQFYASKYFAKLDPLHYAHNVDPKKIYMVMSTNDQTIPTRNQIELWNQLGRPSYELSRLSHISTIIRWFIESSEHAVSFLLDEK